jgi:hypothetical protein
MYLPSLYQHNFLHTTFIDALKLLPRNDVASKGRVYSKTRNEIVNSIDIARSIKQQWHAYFEISL